jgi:hypothetical protein
MVHALSCQWPFGESKLDLKQSSLRRVRSNNLKLASWRAELVKRFSTAFEAFFRGLGYPQLHDGFPIDGVGLEC